MRRSIVTLLSTVVVFGIFLVGGRAIATAQGSIDYSDHPLVGSWSLQTDPDAESLPSQVNFSSDGAYIEVDSDGFVVVGAWEPTGDSTANMMFTAFDQEGGYRVRASLEVAADGKSLTAMYTFELLDPITGEWSGEYGPIAATGTRLVVEPMGTPVGTLDDLISQFEEGVDATPVP